MPYIGNTVQNQGFTPAIDYFSGDGVTVTFTLSRPVVSASQVICAVDNVIQNPSSAFTVSGSSITFTSAPLSGTNNIWVEYTSLITTYNAISQDPSVIGDITASGGFLSTGDFGNSYIDGTIVDYVTGNARITTGPADGLTIYNGGTTARYALASWSTTGALTNTSSIGVGVSPTAPLDIQSDTGAAAINIRGRVSGDIGSISFYNNANSTQQFYIQSRSAYTMLNTVANTYMAFATNDTERMRITSAGNVLINYTNTNLGKFVNNATSATLCVAASGQGLNSFIQSSSAVNNSTVTALRLLNANGDAMGGSAVVGTLFVNASGGSGANQYQATYSLLSGGNGTTDASLTLHASKVRGTNPITSVNIADDGGGGAILITITWANNSGVVTGGAARVGFTGITV